MAQSVNLWGATYSDVPAIEVPKSGGGVASFTDVTDTTAVASDVMQGKYFFTASGQLTLGTASGGGGGSVTVTDEANATGTTCVITSGGSPTPSETWETIWEGTKAPNADTPYNYFWFNEMTNVYPSLGSVWKITVNGTSYRCTAYVLSELSQICIGNPKYSGGTDDGSDVPFNFYNAGWGALVGDTELPTVNYSFKFERLVTE